MTVELVEKCLSMDTLCRRPDPLEFWIRLFRKHVDEMTTRSYGAWCRGCDRRGTVFADLVPYSIRFVRDEILTDWVHVSPSAACAEALRKRLEFSGWKPVPGSLRWMSYLEAQAMESDGK